MVYVLAYLSKDSKGLQIFGQLGHTLWLQTLSQDLYLVRTTLSFLCIHDLNCSIPSSHNQAEHTLYIKTLKPANPEQSLQQHLLAYLNTNQEIKINFTNPNKNNSEGNTVFKIHTNLIWYCSLRREYQAHRISLKRLFPIFILTGFIFTPRNQIVYFSFSLTLVSITMGVLNLVLKMCPLFSEKGVKLLHIK